MDYEGPGRYGAPPEPPAPVEGDYLPREAGQAFSTYAAPNPYQQEAEYGRTDIPYERTGRRRGGIWGALAAAGALALKFAASLKFIFLGLFKIPFLASILINILLYAFLYSTRLGPEYGIAYGAGIVFLIFIHEMGHMVAARMTDTETTNPLFIPFMGAVIGVKSYRNATIEAINGIGGPVLGTLGAIAVLGWAGSLGYNSQWGTLLLRLAYIGFFINLFNMVPVTLGGGFTLDGGRVLQAVSKWVFAAGPALLLLLMVTGVVNSVFFWLFIILGAYGAYRRFQHPDDPAYHTTSLPGKIFITAGYFLLLGVLVLGMAYTEASFTGGF